MVHDETTWRILDTGLRPAAQNLALNQALLEVKQKKLSPNTLRFLRYQPSALVGFHQSVSQELHQEYCIEHHIDIQRRITGGGAIYMDPQMIGWEIYAERKVFGAARMEDIAERICTAVARGISRLGIEARYRPRNDIEVSGRKISGSGGVFEGDSLMYQGTLLLHMDVDRMLKVLRIPAEKLSDKAVLSARERVVGLRELLVYVPSIGDIKQYIAEALAEELDIDFTVENELNEIEKQHYRAALAEIDSHSWVYGNERSIAQAPIQEGVYRSPGGMIRATVALDLQRGLLKQVWLTGDFFVHPSRMIMDLEAALKDTPVRMLDSRVRSFFAEYEAKLYMLQPDDFLKAISLACTKRVEQE